MAARKRHCGKAFDLGQLLDVSVVSSPAYDAATVSLRAFAAKSFARQFDAPYDEVLHDFQTGEQARYFVRTDNRGPAPALVEARAEPTTEDHYLRKRLVEEVGRRIGADGMDWHRAKLELWRKKMAMDEGRPFSPEARSYVTQALMCRRDRWGNAFD